MGGALTAIDNAYMKQALVASNARRLRRIGSGEQVVVGVNRFVETEPNPLGTGMERILKVDPAAERDQIERLRAFRARRNESTVRTALQNLKDAARTGRNVMPVSIACARAGATTGEWSDALRDVFGEYRAPTGVAAGLGGGRSTDAVRKIREKLAETERHIGRKLRLLVGKPGLDGHSNGAEQIALMARDVGFEVIYHGIRSTPAEIAQTAADEDVHIVGLSILSGSHLELVPEILRLLRERRGDELPVVVGGIIPEEDQVRLLEAGVHRIYTPKDFELGAIMDEIVDIVRAAQGVGA
jgi:(2R)-ethylmalonyl-CoA mutase